jgi:hypothetical protein
LRISAGQRSTAENGENAGRLWYNGATSTPEDTTTLEDNPNWRRHKGACSQYRERWTSHNEPGDEGCVLLYQIFCLMNTPPETQEEQQLCMCSTHGCWRLKQGRARARARAAAGID